MDPHHAQDAAAVAAGLGAHNQRFSGRTVLLTGAAGFLGTQFVHYFRHLNAGGRLALPVRVLAVDNFIRGTPAWLATGEPDGGVEVVRGDVTTFALPESVDFIIHAASIASPLFYRQHPIATMDANVLGLRRLLDHAVAHPVERFLFFSTSEIYGDPDAANIPTAEDYRGYVSCTGPRACYDESKRFGETLCVAFARHHGVRVAMARPFNNYGPGLRLSDRRVLPDFFRDALAGRDIVLLSDGRATRTFCYVADAIEGYLRVLLLGEPGEPYNIGCETPEISMRELAGHVIRLINPALRVVEERSPDPEYLTDNPRRRCPRIRKARERLGYEPRVTLADGLARTAAYYRDHPDG